MEEKTTAPKKNICMAVVAYILFFVPLLTEDKNDPFVKYHVKQGLVLFLTAVIIFIVSPFVGLLFILLDLLLLALLVIGILNASNGVEKPLPLIGKLGEKINL